MRSVASWVSASTRNRRRLRHARTQPTSASRARLATRYGDVAPEHARAIVALGDADYPAALLQTADPPCLLYATGRIHQLKNLQVAQSLAMVGSRNPTPQGRLNAHAFAKNLASGGLTIVSGLALGVDGAAHEGALEGADTGLLATVAVVGTGLDRVYPKQHLALARQIAAHGLILSEYPLGTPPLAENFPRRNRIISGLSLGVLVVEASPASGSLITARLAAEQGREVYAIPGSIHHPAAKGCHQLIRDGAVLVETIEHILESLRGWQRLSHAAPVPVIHPLVALLHAAPHSSEALAIASGRPLSQVLATLTELELEGQVICESGRWLARCPLL